MFLSLVWIRLGRLQADLTDLLTCSRKCRVVPSGSPIKLDPKMPAVWCQKDDGVSRPSLALWLDGTVSCSVGVRSGHEVLSFVKVHCCIMHIPLVSWKTRQRLDCQGLKPWSSQCKGRGIFVNGPAARSNRNKRSGPTKTSNQWELTTRRQILARQVDGDPIPPDTTPSTDGGISHYSWAFPVYLGHVVADRSEN